MSSREVPTSPNRFHKNRLLIRRSLVRAQVEEPRNSNQVKGLGPKDLTPSLFLDAANIRHLSDIDEDEASCDHPSYDGKQPSATDKRASDFSQEADGGLVAGNDASWLRGGNVGTSG